MTRSVAGEDERRIWRWAIRALLFALSVASCLCATSQAPPETPPGLTSGPAAVVPPEALAGVWLFEMTRGGQSIQYSLHFSVTSGILAGSLTGPDGNARELTQIALKEDKVAWDVETQGAALHYEGKVSGSSMKGTVKRSAKKRRPQEENSDSKEGSSGSTPEENGRRGGGRHGSRGGRSGRGGTGGQQMTWSAYKSVAPPAESAPSVTPAPAPTPAPRRY